MGKQNWEVRRKQKQCTKQRIAVSKREERVNHETQHHMRNVTGVHRELHYQYIAWYGAQLPLVATRWRPRTEGTCTCIVVPVIYSRYILTQVVSLY